MKSSIDLYASKKKMTMMPVNINGESFKFSTGKHNELQKAIIEEFAPKICTKFKFGVLVRYDTIEKDLVKNVEKLKELGFEITLHDKMPDVSCIGKIRIDLFCRIGNIGQSDGSENVY